MEATKIQMLFPIHFQTEIVLRQEVASYKYRKKKILENIKQRSKNTNKGHDGLFLKAATLPPNHRLSLEENTNKIDIFSKCSKQKRGMNTIFNLTHSFIPHSHKREQKERNKWHYNIGSAPL